MTQIEQSTIYAYKLKYLENPNFDKIRSFAKNFVDELPQDLQSELYEKINRGIDQLETEPEMLVYLYSFGNMHQAKLNYAFEHLPDSFFEQSEINIIDYGCGQAIGTMCYVDFLKRKNPNQKIKSVTLIEPSEICLKRAGLHISVFLPDTDIRLVNKTFDQLSDDDLETIQNFCESMDTNAQVFDQNATQWSKPHNVKVFSEETLKSFIREVWIDTLSSTSTDGKIYLQRYFFINYDGTVKKILADKAMDKFPDKTCFDPSKVYIFDRTALDDGLTITMCAGKPNGKIHQIENDENIPTLHILSNVLDLNFDLPRFSSLISRNIKGYNQFVCVGPYFNYSDKDQRMQEFAESFNGNISFAKMFDKGELNPLKTWTCNILIFTKKKEKILIDFEMRKKVAIQGNVKEQNHIGYCYMNGLGVKKNYNKAAEWFYKAAVQGYAEAQKNLGLCYYSGLGVNKDCSYYTAVKWFRKAAEQGNAIAQYSLGMHYQLGLGVTRDYYTAVEWFRKAAEQGDAKAQYSMGMHYKLGLGVKTDYCIAVMWFRKSAEQGNSEAQCSIGQCYENGVGVYKNLAEAIGWYQKSAEQGEVNAQIKMGSFYKDGVGVEQNYGNAILWYTKAAEQGNKEAQRALGDLYEEGIGVERDVKKALEWYNKCYDILPELTKEKITNGVIIDEVGAIYSKDGSRLLKGCIPNVESYIIKDGTNEICKEAFRFNHSLRNIVIPNSLTTIRDSAFCCTALQEVNIPESVTTIEDYAFSHCTALQEITIPSSVSVIGDSCFEGCSSLQQIKITSNPLFIIQNKMLIDVNNNKILFYFGQDSHVIIPNGITSIGSSAFAHCDFLRIVTIPDSVTTIACDAFHDCDKIILWGTQQIYERFKHQFHCYV